MVTKNVLKDAMTLAEIVIRIIGMRAKNITELMTVFGYMVCCVVRAAARQQGNNLDKEMAKFIDYLTDIYSQEKESEDKANIIKMN